MPRNTRFLGLQYPLAETARGIFAQKNGISQIKADMLQLLLTNPGERVMLPEFGTPLRTLIFEPNDPSLISQARKMIQDSLAAWEPRVIISQVTVTNSAGSLTLNSHDNGREAGAILGIQIQFYDPQDISQVDQLTLELPISGG